MIKLLPKDKFDNSTFNDLINLKESEISIILPELFSWIADFNWPIAEDILSILIKFPNSLIPLIKNSLNESNNDDILKYWVIIKLLPKLPLKIQNKLLPSIERICNSPTEAEYSEDVLEVALRYVNNLKESIKLDEM